MRADSDWTLLICELHCTVSSSQKNQPVVM